MRLQLATLIIAGLLVNIVQSSYHNCIGVYKNKNACPPHDKSLSTLKDLGIAFVYGMLHNCDVFLMSTADDGQWEQVLKAAGTVSDTPECDVAGMDFSFVYDASENIEALKIVHIPTGKYQDIPLTTIPLYDKSAMRTSSLPNVKKFGFTSAFTLTENSLGLVCEFNTKDFLIHIVQFGHKYKERSCVAQILTRGRTTPLIVGFVSENATIYEDLLVLKGFGSRFTWFFLRFYYDYWFTMCIICGATTILSIPLILILGVQYRRMLVASARFNIALDALISTSCDNPDHINRRQKLLCDGGYDTISFREISLNDAALRSKSSLLNEMRGSAKSPSMVRSQHKSIQQPVTQPAGSATNTNETSIDIPAPESAPIAKPVESPQKAPAAKPK